MKQFLFVLRTHWLGHRGLAIVVALLLSMQAEAATLAYVPNQTGASVSVVDVNSGAVITSVPVGAAPIGVSVAPDGQFVYVTEHNSATVSVISTATNTFQAQILAGANPMGVAVSPGGTRLYVTNFLTATASGGGSMWVNGALTVVNTATRTTLATVAVGANPAGAAVSPDGSRVYVANAGSGTLSVVATASNTVTATIAVGANPVGVAASPDGQRVYVANSGSASVSVINAATLAVTSTIRVGGHAYGIAVSADSSRVIVSNTFDNSVSVINTATQTVATTTTVGIGRGPAGVAFVPASSTALVANSKGATLSSINSASGAAAGLTVSALGWPVSLGNFVASVPLTTPSAPTNVSISAGVGSARITFTAPSNTGGGNIESYTATCTAAGHTTRTASGALSPLIVDELTGGVIWSCSVAASNGTYTSAASSVQTVVPRKGVDLTPILMLLLD